MGNMATMTKTPTRAGERITYDEYLATPDDGNRYEIIEGVLYVSPAPNIPHQDASGNLFLSIATWC